MEQGLAGKYYSGLLHEFNKNLREINESNTDVHPLRLSIKEIRAFLTLIEHITKSNRKTKKIRRLMVHLFKTAGELRESQINAELVELDEELSKWHLTDFLRKKQSKFSKRIVRVIDEFAGNKWEDQNARLIRYCHKLEDEVFIKKTGKLIQNKKDHIAILIKPDISDSKLHQIRKELRDVKELMKILSDVKPDSVPEKDKETIKTIMAKIGDWHDDLVLSELIDRKSGSEDSVTRLMEKVDKRLQDKRGEIIQQLLEMNEEI